jgi:hypothetical protein
MKFTPLTHDLLLKYLQNFPTIDVRRRKLNESLAFASYSAWRAFCDHFGTATPVSTSVVESSHNIGFAKQWQPPLGYLKD